MAKKKLSDFEKFKTVTTAKQRIDELEDKKDELRERRDELDEEIEECKREIDKYIPPKRVKTRGDPIVELM